MTVGMKKSVGCVRTSMTSDWESQKRLFIIHTPKKTLLFYFCFFVNKTLLLFLDYDTFSVKMIIIQTQ